MSLCPNPRAVLALAGIGPSVCPPGPGSPVASTPQHCAWLMQKVSTTAVIIATGHHTTIAPYLLVAFNIQQTSAHSL